MNFILIDDQLINLDNVENVQPVPSMDWNHLNKFSTNVWFTGKESPLALNIPFLDFIKYVPHIKIDQNS